MIDTAYEQFSLAVDAMARGTQGIHERVIAALSGLIPVLSVECQPASFPDEIRPYVEEILSAARRIEDPVMGSIAASVGALSAGECSQLAGKIVDLKALLEACRNDPS